ncbi:phosphate starvation-inducible protein PhoH [Micromonospora craniellae]|uniref:PhoH-like protein n=1 Tax=Micromonospora craniellae TaxID=2294034 RepID=A0A372FWI9_9ACTN|nr:PhoH family protein [Micromonospora craniellae]RFS44880.1 phosphate starvation-inducible protein PhoH [Micromonospora craniellae]
MTGTPPPGPPRVQTRITVPDSKIMVNLLGAGDEILRLVERSVNSDVHVRGNEITITGAPADNALAERIFSELLELIEKGETLTTDAVRRTVGMLEQGGAERPAEVLTLNILSRRGRTIRPKTLGQKRYVDAIDTHTIVFGIGPAGTGKTYLAMAKAVQALQAKQVNRIILTRPAVEAGERLGFLPGTLNEKIDPYLRPLYDALHDMLDPETIPKLMAAGTIEVAPLAYMRGRAQPYDARVLTPEGFKPFGSLQVGDLVIGSNGTPTPVIGIYPQGPKKVYRVTTQDGASTLCCGEHLWTVATAEDKRRGRRRTLETREMIGQEWRGHTRRYELPVVAPVYLEPQDVPLDPYVLGLLLGDGAISSRTTPGFCTADPELAHAIEDALTDIELVRKSDYVLRHVHGHRGGVIVANPVTVALRELGLTGARSGATFVPDVYKHNSVDVRLAVLQGLLDMDGGPSTQAGRTCRVQYSTTSSRLRDDVVYLVQSLGGVATWGVRAAEGRKPGLANGRPDAHRADAYVVEIRLPEGVPPFQLARKRQRYEERGGGRPMRFIDSIIPAGVQETMCIQVAAEDSLYVTDEFLVTHNTLNDAFIILDEAQNTTPEQMKMFLTRLGFGSKIVVTGDVTQVDLPGGTTSGLRVVREILEGVEDVHFAQLSSADVVRHRLVGQIVDAYARWDAERENQQAQGVHAVAGRTAQGNRAGRRR